MDGPRVGRSRHHPATGFTACQSDRPRPVGDAEEGDLGRVRRQARRPRSARPTGSAVMLSSLPEAGSTALATHTSISPARRRARAGHRARVPPACVSSESVARHGRRVRSRRAPKATC